MPLELALIVGDTVEVTVMVFTTNVADNELAGTVTKAGTAAELELLDKVTVIPPVGAGPDRVTVPVEDNPPVTLVGLKVSELNDGGLTVSVAV